MEVHEKTKILFVTMLLSRIQLIDSYIPVLLSFEIILFFRAIGRFNIALRMDATYVRAYLCRAEAYEKLGLVRCIGSIGF